MADGQGSTLTVSVVEFTTRSASKKIQSLIMTLFLLVLLLTSITALVSRVCTS